jgi:hypothetical protein
MTAMPEMVSLLMVWVVLCAALISIVEFNHLTHGFNADEYAQQGFQFFSAIDKTQLLIILPD